MLYHLLFPLADDFNALNVLRYITFRTGGAVLTALTLSFFMGPGIIRWLKSKQRKGQPIRPDGPQTHIVSKAGTPTMGGVLVLLALGIATLLWADLRNHYVWVTLLVTMGFGAVGFADDYLKVTRANHKGVSGRLKLVFEIGIAVVAAVWIMSVTPEGLATGLAIPFFKSVLLPLGIFFIPVAVLVMVGASNAVNLTDGLDGLAIVPVMIAAASFMLIAYLVGNIQFADYLQINYVPGTGELAILLGAVIGAGLGFLWYNAPPAMVFMGDTGSLALGGVLGGHAIRIPGHRSRMGVLGYETDQMGAGCRFGRCPVGTRRGCSARRILP